MVSPQALLGVGVGLALASLGAYVLWLWRRLDRLEPDPDRQRGPTPEETDETRESRDG